MAQQRVASPATWAEFEASAPELAAAGRTLLYQFGPGLAFLATVRRDGAPRLHPICPVVLDGRLYGLIGDSPKRRDLLRDGCCALHSFPSPDVDDEFMLSGRALALDDSTLHHAVEAAAAALGVHQGGGERLFEFRIERALHAKYGPRGPSSWPPAYTKWRAG
jgi:hypothetical protein